MKTKALIVIYFSLSVCIFSCKNNIESAIDVITINEDEKFEEKAFKLEDFLNEVKLIRLETNENSLITYFRGFVGEKYIIAIEQTKILLFSSDGTFIKTISTKGKGPKEFMLIDAWDVDPNEKFLVYHDRSKNYLTKYNLDEGKYEDDIPFEDKGQLNTIIVINDTLLAVLRDTYSKYEHEYFFYSTNGRIVEGEKKDPIPYHDTWIVKKPIFSKAEGHSIIYQPHESKTIYQISGKNKTPMLTMKLEEPQKKGNITIGYHVAFTGLNKNNIFLTKYNYESEVTPDRSSYSMSSGANLVYNRDEKSIYSISSLFYDDLGIELVHQFHPINNNQFLLTIQANEFKGMIKHSMEYTDITEKQREKLMQLDDIISGNDNPIIITGTIADINKLTI